MVVGHHLLLHTSPLIVTNYVSTEIKKIDIGVLHEVTLHTRHYSRTKQSLKVLKLFNCT